MVMGKYVGKFCGITFCLLAFWVGQALASESIKIGVPGAHSGNLASYGLPSLAAAKLVIKQANEAGGVLGRQVELLAEDDVCKPEVAANTAAKLVSEHVDAVIGHTCSGATKAALGIYKAAHIVTISPSATNPDLTNGNYPNFFRTIASDDAQARREVDFALNVLHVKKIAVIHDKGDYGKGLAEFVRKFIEESGRAKVVLFEGVTPGAVDYSAIVQKIKRKRAEAVIFGGYHPEASKVVGQMRRKRLKAFFVSDDGVKDDTFIKVAGKYAEGVYATGPTDTSKNPLTQKAFSAYEKAYGKKPGAFFLNAWAATQALLNAINQAGSTDYAKIVAALHREYIDTPLGKISFDKNGEAIGVGFAIYQVQNGRYVELK